MKRDMDLIRKILLEVEKQEGSSEWPEQHTIPRYKPEQITYHIGQLHENGLIKAGRHVIYGGDYQYEKWEIYKLTWEGHNFLDAIRADTIWEKTKDKMSEKGYDMPFEMIKDVALGLIKAALNQ